MNNDLIRRSDLKAAVDDICYSWGRETEVEGGVLIDLVDKLPAVDAEVVRHGRWEHVSETNYHNWETVIEEKCSVCGRYTERYDTVMPDNYCPNCGCKMDGEHNDIQRV